MLTNKSTPAHFVGATLIVTTNHGDAKMPVWCRAEELVGRLANFRKGMQDKIDSGEEAWKSYVIVNASIEFSPDEFPQLDGMVS